MATSDENTSTPKESGQDVQESHEAQKRQCTAHRDVWTGIRSALHRLIDGETHEPPICTSLRILSLQCLCAHALHYCCMSGFTIQYPEQQKAESQNLSTSLYPQRHARCLQRADCSSTSFVAKSDVVDARETSHKHCCCEMWRPDLTCTSCVRQRHWPNLGQHSCRKDKNREGREEGGRPGQNRT